MSGAPNLHALIHLQQTLLTINDRRALSFEIVNETKKLVQYDQAILFTLDAFARMKLTSISGQVAAIEDTPFTQWLTKFHRQCLDNLNNTTTLTSVDIPESLLEGWGEWWHQYALVVPLTHNSTVIGYLVLNRTTPFSETEIKSLHLLATHMAYAQAALTKYSSHKHRWFTKTRLLSALAGVCLISALSFKLPLSITVNAEIIAEHTTVVAAPLDGVVSTLHVAPNTLVKQGDLLFELDDSILRNELNIARQELVIAQVETHTMEQRAFHDMDSKAELASLRGKIKEKQAQISLIQDKLTRTKVFAEFDGYAIYNDEDDWLGVPVRTGERIIKLAAPTPIGVQGWIPVADVITLDKQSPFKLYLRSDPLTTYAGNLVRQSFQPITSPDGVAAYQFEGEFASTSDMTDDNDRSTDHMIGARGVATLYGEEVSLAYFLMRRPIGILRQWLGW